MKELEFKKTITPSGEIHFLHIENGKKREQLLKDRMSGIISPLEFEKEQKKMRGGKYLQYIFTESQYLKATSIS